jgi:hypothetical protein
MRVIQRHGLWGGVPASSSSSSSSSSSLLH